MKIFFDGMCSFVVAKICTSSSCTTYNRFIRVWFEITVLIIFFVSDKISKSYLLKWEDVIRAAARAAQLLLFYNQIKLKHTAPMKTLPTHNIILSYYDNVVILICTNQKHQFQGDLTHHSYYSFCLKFHVNTKIV